MSLPCLNIYREWFYPEPSGGIGTPSRARRSCSLVMQAKTSDNGVTFATHCLSEAELSLLIEVLLFGLICTLQHWKGKSESNLCSTEIYTSLLRGTKYLDFLSFVQASPSRWRTYAPRGVP
ncbi:putative LAGLIDADG homing endonuclease [Rhizophagus diaphanus]|nr:putative LAGLIDADG homing endonuclease [Rhizophagus diaphanus] [Rhizophagus sp. MUCL 43196]